MLCQTENQNYWTYPRDGRDWTFLERTTQLGMLHPISIANVRVFCSSNSSFFGQKNFTL